MRDGSKTEEDGIRTASSPVHDAVVRSIREPSLGRNLARFDLPTQDPYSTEINPRQPELESFRISSIEAFRPHLRRQGCKRHNPIQTS